MNIVKEFKQTYAGIPLQVKQFLKRALIIFIGWKLLYVLLLYPLRLPDKQLTHLTSSGTKLLLSKIYSDRDFMVGENCVQGTDEDKRSLCSDYVMMGHCKVIKVDDGCNGLELMILYIGFLFCIPADPGRMIAYSISGIVMIGACNILRCMALALMNLHHYVLTDIAHHYVFKAIVYGLIFLLWIAYCCNNIKESHE